MLGVVSNWVSLLTLENQNAILGDESTYGQATISVPNPDEFMRFFTMLFGETENTWDGILHYSWIVPILLEFQKRFTQLVARATTQQPSKIPLYAVYCIQSEKHHQSCNRAVAG